MVTGHCIFTMTALSLQWRNKEFVLCGVLGGWGEIYIFFTHKILNTAVSDSWEYILYKGSGGSIPPP